MSNESDLRAVIVSAINKVRADSGRSPLEPDDGDALTGEIGFDSLDLAVLVVTLEQELNVDPFRDGTQTARTLGELVTVYREATQA